MTHGNVLGLRIFGRISAAEEERLRKGVGSTELTLLQVELQNSAVRLWLLGASRGELITDKLLDQLRQVIKSIGMQIV